MLIAVIEKFCRFSLKCREAFEMSTLVYEYGVHLIVFRPVQVPLIQYKKYRYQYRSLIKQTIVTIINYCSLI